MHRHTKFIIKHLQSFCPNENNQRTRVQPARTYCSSQHNSTGVHKGKGCLMQAPVDRLLLDPRRLRWLRGFTSKAQSEAQTRAVKVPSHSSHCTFVSCRCAPRREHEVESSKFKLNTVSKRCKGTCALTRGCSHGHGHLAHRVYHAWSHRPCAPCRLPRLGLGRPRLVRRLQDDRIVQQGLHGDATQPATNPTYPSAF